MLRRTYLSDRDPRSLRYSSKLILNENNHDFYQSNLINLRKRFVQSMFLMKSFYRTFHCSLYRQKDSAKGLPGISVSTH